METQSRMGHDCIVTPDENSFIEWKRLRLDKQFIINCPDENDARTVCAWMNWDQSDGEQLKEWDTVKDRMNYTGPVLCGLLKGSFQPHKEGFDEAASNIAPSNAENYFGVSKEIAWTSNHPSQELAKVCRKDGKDISEYSYNTPISPTARAKL